MKGISKMQNRENNLIKVKEAAEFLISTEFENADKKDEQYKLALKKAKAKIYTAIKKHQLDIFGETTILLNRNQVKDFKDGKITARSIYSPFGNMELDFDESVKFIESFHNPNSIKEPLKYKTRCQYGVTNKGRVLDLTYRRVLSQNKAAHDYMQVSIRVNNKSFPERTHVLVASAWCANGKLKNEVHHIDGDIFNNNYINLIWMTHSEHLKAHKLLDEAKVNNDFTEYNNYIDEIRKDNRWEEEYRCVAFEKDNATIFVWITKKAYTDYKTGTRTLSEIYFDEVKTERIVRKCPTEKKV